MRLYTDAEVTRLIKVLKGFCKENNIPTCNLKLPFLESIEVELHGEIKGKPNTENNEKTI